MNRDEIKEVRRYKYELSIMALVKFIAFLVQMLVPKILLKLP